MLTSFDTTKDRLRGSFKISTPTSKQSGKISFRYLRQNVQSETNLDPDADDVVEAAILNTLFKKSKTTK